RADCGPWAGAEGEGRAGRGGGGRRGRGGSHARRGGGGRAAPRRGGAAPGGGRAGGARAGARGGGRAGAGAARGGGGGRGAPLAERAGGAAVGAVMWTLRTVPGPIEAVRRIAAPHSGLWRAAVRRGFFGPDARIADVAACAQQMHAVPADVLGEYHAALVRHDVRDRLKALHRVPVTVLTGGYDRMIAPSHAQDLCRALPGARPHTVDRAGHMLPVEAPEKVSALLAELCGVDL